MLKLFNRIIGNASKTSVESLYEKYGDLLIEGETIELGFQLVRDVFMFTNKRLILIDVQGITGSKTEFLTLPYKSISRFSLETAGSVDLDAELKLWVSSEKTPFIRKNLKKGTDIYEIQRFLAEKVLK